MDQTVRCSSEHPTDGVAASGINRSARTPITVVRLLLLSGLVGLALVVISFFLGSGQAHAAAPAAPSSQPGSGSSLVGSLSKTVEKVAAPVSTTVSGTAKTAGSTVGGVTKTVEKATAPVAPVHKVVSAVVPVVPKAVAQVAATKPVAHVVAPVATTVDKVVDTVTQVAPPVAAVTGKSPVSTVTKPVADTVDSAVSGVSDGVSHPTTPIIPPGVTSPPAPHVPPVVTSNPTHAVLGGDPVASVSESASASATAPAEKAHSAASSIEVTWGTAAPRSASLLPVAATSVTGVSTTGSTMSDPAVPTPAHSPADQPAPGPVPAAPAGMNGSASSGGSGSAGAIAMTADFGYLPTLALLTSGTSERDAVPLSPTYDSDTTPD